jgi:hypothetical protein
MKRAQRLLLRCRLLALAAISCMGGCERAGFESLGMLLPSAPIVPAVVADAGFTQPTLPPMFIQDAGEVLLSTGGNPSPPAAGGGGASGNPSAGVAGSGVDAASPPGPLTGNSRPAPFGTVQAAYVIGNSDEFGTTTLYLIDSSVTCDQVSRLAWLNQLPSSVQVIEIIFLSSVTPSSAAVDSVISVGHGGMYSFTKERASTHMLLLSQYMIGGGVDGTLEATFTTGSVSGAFHATFCASGMTF